MLVFQALRGNEKGDSRPFIARLEFFFKLIDRCLQDDLVCLSTLFVPRRVACGWLCFGLCRAACVVFCVASSSF